MTWVPLHVHSQYSILDATAPIKTLAAQAAELELPALALTDHGSLYGLVEFFKACKGKGVKPILGLDAYLAPGCHTDKQRQPGMHFVAYLHHYFGSFQAWNDEFSPRTEFDHAETSSDRQMLV